MTKRRLILAIAIWILAATLVFVLWQYASAQRRRVEPSLYLDFPMLAVPPPMEAANHGNVWFDPNGDFIFRDHLGNKNYLGDMSTIHSPNLIPPIGIDQNAPIDECYVQLSDKLVICREFTSAGIQTCRDAIGGVGEIKCPEGTYSFTSTVTMSADDQIIISGSGDGTVFELDSNNISMFTVPYSVKQFVMRDINFQGNGDSMEAPGTKFVLYSVSGSSEYNLILFENCRFEDYDAYGLYFHRIAYGQTIRFNNCIFYNQNYTYGHYGSIYAENEGGVLNITNSSFIDTARAIDYTDGGSGFCGIANNYFHGNRYCIKVNETGLYRYLPLTIESNHFYWSGFNSIELIGVSRPQIIGNHFFYYGTTLKITNGISPRISNNSWHTTKDLNIDLNSVNYPVIDKNTFSPYTTDAWTTRNIDCNDVDYAIFSQNSFNNHGPDGEDVKMYTNCNGYIFINNHLDSGLELEGLNNKELFARVVWHDKYVEMYPETEPYYCDDAESFEVANAVLGPDGGKLVLASGTYYVDDEFTIDCNNLVMEGFGDSTILMMDTNAGWGINAENVSNVALKNFVINCADQEWQTNYAPLGFNTVNGGIIENIKFKDNGSADYCVIFNDVDNITVRENEFDPYVNTAALYMDSNDTGNLFYGNKNLTFADLGNPFADFQINEMSLWFFTDDTLVDDGTVNLPDATDGMVFVSITDNDPNAAISDESGMWMVTNSGVVSKVSGTANTDAADTDGDLCVYDGGTYGIIKNRLGGVGALRAFYFYQ